MEKRCPCGDIMTMKLRTVIYSGKVEIDNVPIFSCPACSHSEVFSEVKPDLTGLIDKIGQTPSKQSFLFNEWNEWADLLVEVRTERKKTNSIAVQEMIEDRINSLLELMLFADSIQDEEWERDIEKRLAQISIVHRSGNLT